jgi:DNA-directed RNA polymerase specialized sigma24 family protein
VSTAIAASPNGRTLAAQAADPAASGAIDDHCFARVYSHVCYRAGSAQAVEDLTAVTLERALVQLDRYDPARAPFAAWLSAIARNAMRDHLCV